MKMRAMVLKAPAFIDTSPLQLREVDAPQAQPGQIRVRVLTCGICRTDLHVIEAELPTHKPDIIPGHQIVGVVDQLGTGANRFKTEAQPREPSQQRHQLQRLHRLLPTSGTYADSFVETRLPLDVLSESELLAMDLRPSAH